ncbi:MAG: 4Fe-4S binding protein, partial [Methanospirillum sp.]|uniref:4Fe-4S binding protein n=1 Tax=Methanospirillum sp. TaxID=45200 RepID=UPI0023709EAE
MQIPQIISAPPSVDTVARKHGRHTIVASILTFCLVFFFTSHGTGSLVTVSISGLLALVGGLVTYSILKTGTINRFRLLIYTAMGIIFTISFSVEHTLTRGSILMSESIASSGTTPICPIAIPFVSIPLAITGKMIFPSTVAALLSILFFWLAMVILLGRGWCSWICFFGWISQFFAALPKKPLIRLESVPKWAKMLPYALMLFFILVALVTFSPLFCSWVCPLRILYDPPSVTTSIDWIKALIFVIGGFVL